MRAVRDRRSARAFRPEFINRLDEIVVFHRLEREQLAKIIDIQLRALRRAARASASIELDVTQAARDVLAEVGWDPQYGARPLKRAIQRTSRTRSPSVSSRANLALATPSWSTVTPTGC